MLLKRHHTPKHPQLWNYWLWLLRLAARLILGRTRKFIPPPWYKGRGGWWSPSHEFFICCSISKRFCLQWKSFDLFNKIRYILLGGGAARGLWRHQQWPPSWILPRIKTAINGNFLCFTCKIIHKKALCIISSTSFTFIVDRSWNNLHFHSKMAWPPATYDVISRNHSNWCTNSYWKRQVMMFYRLG